MTHNIAVTVTELHHGKIGLKGPGVVAWFSAQGIALPGAMYDTARPTPNDLLVRTGTDECVAQSAPGGEWVDRIGEATGRGVYRFEHQEVTLILEGADVNELWAQTCGFDLAKAPRDRAIYTRVAGVSCAIIPERDDLYRVWVGHSFGPYLRQTLSEIITGVASR